MSEPKKNKKEICLEFLMGKIRLLKSQEGVPFAIFQENDKRTIVRMPSQQFLERIRLILTEIFLPATLTEPAATFYLLLEVLLYQAQVTS